MESLALVLRVLFSLTVVVAMLWGLAHVLRSRAGVSAHAALSVQSRVAVGRRSSVALVSYDGQGYLIGVTEQQVTLLALAEVPDTDDLDPPVVRLPVDGPSPTGASAMLPALVEALRGRTARR